MILLDSNGLLDTKWGTWTVIAENDDFELSEMKYKKGNGTAKCKCKKKAVIYSPNTGVPYCSEAHMVKYERPGE